FPNPPNRGPDGIHRGIALALDVKGGTTEITVTLGPGPTGTGVFEVYAHEYAGIAATNAVDVILAGSGNAADGPRVTSGAGTTSAPHELVFGFVSGTVSVSPGASFNPRSTFDRNLTEDREVLSVGSYEATATAGPSGEWTMLMATLRGR